SMKDSICRHGRAWHEDDDNGAWAEFILSGRCLSAMGCGPGFRVLEEGSHVLRFVGAEMAKVAGRLQHVPPGGKADEVDALSLQVIERLREDAVMEHDQRVAHLAARGPDGVDEVELAAT